MIERRSIPPAAAPTFRAAVALLRTLPADLEAETHWTDLGRATGAICTHCPRPTRGGAGGWCPAHYKRHQRAHANQVATINRKARTPTRVG